MGRNHAGLYHHWLETGDPPDSTSAERLAQECPLWNTHDIGKQSTAYIQNCLDLGANHTPSGQQQHPLHLAVQQHNIPAVRVLLQAGANPNATHASQPPALHHAVSDLGSIAMIELLLEYGGDPTLPSHLDYRETALHIALNHWVHHWEDDILTVVDLLLEAGADVGAFTSPGVWSVGGSTPLHYVVGASERFERDANFQLDAEAWAHVQAVFQALLDAGASIDARWKPAIPPTSGVAPGSSYGLTALYHAVSHQHIHFGGTETVQFLLDNGADPNIKVYQDIRGTLVPDRTVFLYMLSGGGAISTSGVVSLEMVELFLDNDADPNLLDADGRNALFYVRSGFSHERDDIERALIVAGADPTHTYTGENGETISYTCRTTACQTVQDAAGG